jgi:trans-2,3-dihydro-3-hydroxyanthranilate isomerase
MQQTGAGILPVEFSFHDGRPVRVTMTQKPARFLATKLNRATLAETLGLKASDLDPTLPPEFVSTGISNLMVPIRNRKTLSKIHMNMRAVAQLISRNGVMAYCFALGGRGKAFARGMLPWGLIEDPATGSAGGSLGAYLVERERLKPGETLTILQGVEMGRPSEIQVEVTSARGRLVPKVSGSAVRVFEGHIDA